MIQKKKGWASNKGEWREREKDKDEIRERNK
jgi:hypothetical protein